MSHSKLFEPLTLLHGPPMRNRFMLAPLTNQQSEVGGDASEFDQDWIAQLARGGYAAVRGSDQMHALGDPAMRIAGRYRQTSRAQRRQIGKVVANESHFVQAYSLAFAQRPHLAQFVFGAGEYLDTKFGGAPLGGLAVARSDQRHRNARFLQQYQPLPVENVERLRLAAFVIVVQAAIGQRAVHVETGQLDLARACAEIGIGGRSCLLYTSDAADE